MRRSSLLLITTLLGIFHPVFSDSDLTNHANEIISNNIVLDTHIDTTQRFIWDDFDLGQWNSRGSIDIPRMHQGKLSAAFFSIWVPGKITGQAAAESALTQIAAVHDQVKSHANDMMFCRTSDEVVNAYNHGKIAVLMGVEGGHMIANDLGVLRQFAALGVRYMTLTHSVNTDWGDSSTDKPRHNGLTSFGKKVVREMNRLGMMVDISHVSDKTFYDALTVSRAPMIASHSSVRAICHSPRNMTDKMIKALAAKGGVIQINYYTAFLNEKYRTVSESQPEFKALSKAMEKRCGENQACAIQGETEISRKMVEEGKLPKVSWETIIDHIDHVAKLVGTDHVGLGSDFDGAFMPYGMEDASHLPQITKALIARGYSDADIKKILGGNILRVMHEVEAVAKQMNA